MSDEAYVDTGMTEQQGTTQDSFYGEEFDYYYGLLGTAYLKFLQIMYFSELALRLVDGFITITVSYASDNI